MYIIILYNSDRIRGALRNVGTQSIAFSVFLLPFSDVYYTHESGIYVQSNQEKDVKLLQRLLQCVCQVKIDANGPQKC